MDFSDYRPFIDITNSLNDDPSSRPTTLSDSDIESDVTDIHITPQRSSSRLGFNFAQGGEDGCEAENAEAEKQARLKWTYSLFQTKDQDSADLHGHVPVCVDLAFCSSGSSELEDDSESSSDDSDEDDPPAGIASFPGPPIHYSVSSLHLPLANGPPARPPPAPFLSSILSPLSPHHTSTQTSRTPPQPIDANHHGLSKSALMHQKWFWSTRYDEWAIWEAQMGEADALSDAYGGMAILPGTCPALSRNGNTSPRKTPPPSPSPSPAFNPANSRIFPRLGDISALRDPYSMNIDRCFCRFPLWTVHKTLYMFDMHHLSAGRGDKTKNPVSDSEPLSNGPTKEEQCDEVVQLTESSDGEVTLISEDAGFTTQGRCSKKEDSASEPEGEDSGFRTWDGLRAWEISWYARWELLIELVKRDDVKRNALECIATSSSEPPPMFYFAGESGEMEEEDDDDDDDDDDDYGTIISNPLYGRRVEAGFGRALECLPNDVRSGAKMICV